jgi:GGDEF domain-containing protein
MRAEDVDSPDPVIGLDARLCVVFANAAAALAGSSAAAMGGQPADRTDGPPMLHDIAQQLREVARSRMDGVPCFARDITDMRRTGDRLRDSVGRDSLTGLLNHAAFHDEVSRALGAGGQADDRVALVLIDMDYLKLINDVHGHQTGDQALRAVADALRARSREGDRVARLGGDEFAALFVGVDREVVLPVAQRAVAQVLQGYVR